MPVAPSNRSQESRIILDQIDHLPPLPPLAARAQVESGSRAIAQHVVQLMEMMPTTAETDGLPRSEFWRHSLAVACASRRIAGEISAEGSQDELFVQGLLHDIGKLALSWLMPRSYAKSMRLAQQGQHDICEVERDLLGVDHQIAGHRLAQRWNLPSGIADAILLHHHEASTLPVSVRIVQWADLMARELGIGFSGNPCIAESVYQSAQELGLSDSQWLRIKESLSRDVDSEAAWIHPSESEGPREYLDALHRWAAESVISMAAGAAHELNNPLAVISGRAQMLDDSTSDAGSRQALSVIRQQAQAASDVVTQLLEIADPPPPSPQAVDVVQLLTHLRESLIDAGLLAESQITIESQSDREVAYFDAAQLAWVLREILDNAIDATEADARRLTVKIARDVSEKNLVLQVADNGRGMTAEVMARAMDPFFSHRQAGRKRGLGLARVGQWLRQGGGSIRFESEPGKGTCVELRIPAMRSS